MSHPCGHVYPSNGDRCAAPEEVHRGEHEYVPWDRRSGTDRRAAVDQADKGDERQVAAAYGVTTEAGHTLVAEHAAGFVAAWDIDTFSERIAAVERAAASPTQPAPELDEQALLADHDGLACDYAFEACGGDHVLVVAYRAALAARLPTPQGG